MSLLNDLLKSVFAKTNPTGQEQVPSQGQADVLITAALAMLDQAGGIQGIIEKFQRSGLGDIVASWVGTGQSGPDYRRPRQRQHCRRRPASQYPD